MDLPKVDGRKTIAIDFNGCLDQYSGWQGSAISYPPREGVEPFLAMLVTKGYKLLVFTASNVQQVKQWICKYGLDQYIDDVVNTKPPAIVYLDDRAVNFTGDFDKAFNDIVNFHTFWEDKSEEQGAKW